MADNSSVCLSVTPLIIHRLTQELINDIVSLLSLPFLFHLPDNHRPLARFSPSFIVLESNSKSMAQQTPEFKLVLVGDGGVGTYLLLSLACVVHMFAFR